MKICAYVACRKEFEPTHGKQKYCGASCQKKAASRNWYEKNKERQRKNVDEWQKKNPEKAKDNQLKQTAKSYRIGRLPRWMYS
jgi:Fe-S-cluster containining protein